MSCMVAVPISSSASSDSGSVPLFSVVDSLVPAPATLFFAGSLDDSPARAPSTGFAMVVSLDESSTSRPNTGFLREGLPMAGPWREVAVVSAERAWLVEKETLRDTSDPLKEGEAEGREPKDCSSAMDFLVASASIWKESALTMLVLLCLWSATERKRGRKAVCCEAAIGAFSGVGHCALVTASRFLTDRGSCRYAW